MSGIAELLINLGYPVSGSDIKKSAVTDRLAKIGARVLLKHDGKNIDGSDIVVTSSAIKDDNPEVVAAKDKKITLLRRAEMLAELMRMKYGIAVSGSHGKTTTTSLIAAVLAKGGMDPTAVIGGKLISTGTNTKLGQGEFIVAEADESDGTFLRINPSIAVVTNIDREHLDYYGNEENLRESFTRFLNKVPFYGTSVVCTDDENIQEILPSLEKRMITYGFNSQADYSAEVTGLNNFSSEFKLIYKRDEIGFVKANLSGKHNVLNLLAAIAVGRELEIPIDNIIDAIGEFEGIERRFQKKGERRNVTVVDDYGHHPNEIKATLSAARKMWKGKIGVLFQPHRYTRTLLLMEEFYKSFYDCDILAVTDIYAAGELPIEGINAEKIAEGIKMHGHKNVSYIKDRKKIISFFSKALKEGDMFITLGAGNVYEVGEEYLKRK